MRSPSPSRKHWKTTQPLKLETTEEREEAILASLLKTKTNSSGKEIRVGVLGVDGSGYVWNAVDQLDAYDEFTPLILQGDGSYAAIDPEWDDFKGGRLRAVGCDDIMRSGKLLEDPASWRPMDVVAFTGHVMLVYDCVPVDGHDGMWQVTIHHSGESTGPTSFTAYYRETDGAWRGSADGAAKSQMLSGEDVSVVRPVNGDLVDDKQSEARLLSSV